MTHPFPPPSIKPFERLQATDGLLINAERWRKAHDYHRQRQSALYQSLSQPGIVCGLGVRSISPPERIDPQYRDRRWVQIQPGIAIDLFGNLIVISQPMDFRIATEVTSEPVMVYLVVSYVDPDELRRDGRGEVVQETFRIDEKSNSPQDSEVEVCRVLLQPGNTEISHPADVFFPNYNNIDLRHRIQAQARPQALVKMAQVNHSDPECARNFFNLSYLLQSLASLYPALQGTADVDQVTFDAEVAGYDLLYLTGRQALSLAPYSREFEILKSYLHTGGVLLVDAPTDATTLIESTQSLAQHLGHPLTRLEELRRDHPLRTKPFLFAALPSFNQHQLRVWIGGGIILLVGDLGAAWGPDKELSLSRVTIRTAHELGINALYYAWRRRRLIGLQQEDDSGQW